jgi:hypothetical protein
VDSLEIKDDGVQAMEDLKGDLGTMQTTLADVVASVEVRE